MSDNSLQIPRLKPDGNEARLCVDLIDYTGFGGNSNPDHAANVLLFAKSTRLGLSSDTLAKIWNFQVDRREEELKKVAETIPAAWEFVHYTFLVRNCTRAFTHQLVRTREASYAQETMRVLDKGDFKYDGPWI